MHKKIRNLPAGDIIIHCGDYSNGFDKFQDTQFVSFIKWFGSLDYEYKIFIPGNHDSFMTNLSKKSVELIDTFGITLLLDSSIVINGFKIYGTPWIPKIWKWYFMDDEEGLRKRFEKIPEDTNILITHTPPFGILDQTFFEHVGSKALLERVMELKDLQIHLFGHIHESRGMEKRDGIRFVNASLFKANKDHFLLDI
jgi:Icc-related predicted phosphoesterase